MKAKSILALLLALVLALGLLSSCGTAADSGQDTGKQEAEPAKEDAAEPAKEDGGEPAAEVETSDDPITFKYFSADMNNTNWDTPVGRAITEATGVTLDCSYPVGSVGAAGDDIALMIASGEYPDMIYAKGGESDLYAAGAFIDMTNWNGINLIEEYGPNIKKMYGEELKKLEWGEGDHGIYQLSAYEVGAVPLTSPGSCQLQYKVLEWNDWKYPTTIAEYEDIIRRYGDAHDWTCDDGSKMYGLTISASDWHWMITLGNPAGFIADAEPDNGQWLVDEDMNVIYKHTTEAEHDYFEWLNRMYLEGILDPDFATQTDEDYLAKIANGQSIGILDSSWHYNNACKTCIADGRIGDTMCGLPVTFYEGDKCPMMMYQGLTVGVGIGITVSCKDPVRAMKFLDYLCSDEGQVLYHWGVEGEQYFVDENGNRYRTEEEINLANTDPDYSKNTGIGNYVGFPRYGSGAMDATGQPYTVNTRQSVIDLYNDIEKAACEAWGVEMLIDILPPTSDFEQPPYSPIWAYSTPQEFSEMQSKLDEYAQIGLVTVTRAAEGTFEDEWQKMQDTFKELGVEECQDAFTQFVYNKVNGL